MIKKEIKYDQEQMKKDLELVKNILERHLLVHEKAEFTD